MEFFIKKNATLPVLKMLVVKDGRSDFQVLMNDLQQSNVTFSMSEVKTGIPKIVDAPCEIIEKNTPNGNVEHYVYFKFNETDTKVEGKYKGSFSIGNNQGTLILPLTEEIYINIQDSFISVENCCSDQPYLNPNPTGTQPTPTPTPSPGGQIEIGQMYAGGMIAYIDETGEHGFVVNVIKTGSPMLNEGIWGRTGEFFGVTGTTIGLAGTNTDIMMSNSVGVQGVCVYYITTDDTNGYTDWKLPTLDEMIQIYSVNNFINRYGERWTSSEIDSNYAYCFNMYDGTYGPKIKSSYNYFLGIRYF